jgi:hypothetical protein
MDAAEEFVARLADANRILAEVYCALDRCDVACCAARFIPAISHLPELVREQLIDQFNDTVRERSFCGFDLTRRGGVRAAAAPGPSRANQTERHNVMTVQNLAEEFLGDAVQNAIKHTIQQLREVSSLHASKGFRSMRRETA